MGDWVDVSKQVGWYGLEDELLALTKCVCGQIFEPWDFIVSIYADSPHTCRKCGREYYFRNDVRVYARGGEGNE